jgi:hypothetical protein
VTRDIGNPTPEITEQVGEDGFGQQEELLVPRIVLDHTKGQALGRRRFDAAGNVSGCLTLAANLNERLSS